MPLIRTFTNSLNLSQSLILLRLYPLDPDIVLDVRDIETETFEIHHHLAVYSILDTSVIQNAISTVATQEEQTKIDDYLSSKDRVASIPNWATWTEQEAAAWWNINLSDSEVDAITDLTSAKEMLKKQNNLFSNVMRILIALRDKNWPSL